MSEPDLSKNAATALRSQDVEALPDSDKARRATLAAMEQALLQQHHQEVPSRRWIMGLALAAGLLLAVGASVVFYKRGPSPGGTTVVASASSIGTLTAPKQAPQALVAGAPLPETSRV